MQITCSESATDARARRAAKRVGLLARKSRWRRDSIDHKRGVRLIDSHTNGAVDGERFDLTAEDVIEYCAS